MNKKIFTSCLLIMTLLLSSCGTSNKKQNYDLSNLSAEEQQRLDDFQKEILGNLTDEEKNLLTDRDNYVAAVARDVVKNFLDIDREYSAITNINKGTFMLGNVLYNRVDIELDDEYYTSLLVSNETQNYLLYNKETEETSPLEYKYYGNFCRNLGPWVGSDQKLVTLTETPERVGTSFELFRELETNELKLEIQTYQGFENISSISVYPTLVNDNELEFTFKDDDFGHSGHGTLNYISEEIMELHIITNKIDGEFGMLTGDITAIKNRT